MQGIIIEPGMEKVYSIHNFDMSSTDSASFDVSSKSFLRLVNGGADESYDLTLRLASTAGGSSGEIKDIPLGGHSAHLIWPDWSDLTAPVKVEIDNNNDGSVDDTIYVNAEPTDAPDPQGNVLPHEFVLGQNYPNPFNPVTTIEYRVPSRAQVSIEILNVLGQNIRTLVNETKSAGSYRIEWNGTDDEGRPVSTGAYLYRLTAGEFVQTRKMLLVK